MTAKMVALMTFNGDAKEGLHLKGQEFLTSEARALKYASNRPKLALRVAFVEETFVPVKDETPQLPKQRKVVAPKAKKKGPAKRAVPAKKKRRRR